MPVIGYSRTHSPDIEFADYDESVVSYRVRRFRGKYILEIDNRGMYFDTRQGLNEFVEDMYPNAQEKD